MSCEVLVGSRMVELGGAEPIRFLLDFVVFEIYGEMRWRREKFQFSARGFAVIG